MLLRGAERLGIALSQKPVDQLAVYLDELVRWNRRVNLTALRSDRDIVIKHFLDSLTPLSFLHPSPNERWIDIGSGAGFPGLVLKIASPHIQMTLVEATGKKAAFLHHLVGLLGLTGVTVIQDRLEHLRGPKYEKQFDLLLTRAVAAEGILSAGPALVRAGGALLLFQGAADRPSWEARLHPHPGLTLKAVFPITLPFAEEARSLVLLTVAEGGFCPTGRLPFQDGIC
ncbi:MAG: 16S rRNA (guanine(527)-N(7))-methyltransferase RsmG [Nitrospirae bacterium]|nr:16S rRNA (guanine(527)-N(7))-methyltransferase RsmG [Candidatus Manganitrophaceae bacterium]